MEQSNNYQSTFQKYKKRRMLVFIISFLFLISGALLVIGYVETHRIDNRSRAGWNSFQKQNDQSSRDVTAPEVVNVAPRKAIVGEKYAYFIKFTDPDSAIENVSVGIVTAPAWLSINGNIISGTPSARDIGSNKITLYITDGYNRKEVEFFISVESSLFDN